jgi:hypothetical protein
MRICAAIRQLTHQLIRPILHLQPIPPSVIPPSVTLGSRDWKAIPVLLPAIPALKAVPQQGLAAWDLVTPAKVRAHLQDLMAWAKTVLTALVPVLALMVLAAAPAPLMVPALMVPALMVLAVRAQAAMVQAVVMAVAAAAVMEEEAVAVVMAAATVADDSWLLDL